MLSFEIDSIVKHADGGGWNVAFRTVLSTGQKQYCPVEVFKNETPSESNHDIITAALVKVLPGQLLLEYQDKLNTIFEDANDH